MGKDLNEPQGDPQEDLPQGAIVGETIRRHKDIITKKKRICKKKKIDLGNRETMKRNNHARVKNHVALPGVEILHPKSKEKQFATVDPILRKGGQNPAFPAQISTFTIVQAKETLRG